MRILLVLLIVTLWTTKSNALSLSPHQEQFLENVNVCIDNLPTKTFVPRKIILGMAALESGWGTSRFFLQGNNLFGIRTFDQTVPHLKPLDNPMAEFGVKLYAHPCDSVQDMVSILSEHRSYEKFRKMIFSGLNLYTTLAALKPWAEDIHYDKKLKGIIKKL